MPFRQDLSSRQPSWWSQAVTALAFAEGGRLLVSAGGDTLVAVWQVLDVLDGPASPTPPAPLFSWCGWAGILIEARAAALLAQLVCMRMTPVLGML